MTLKIELKTGGGKTTIYLTGRLRAECLDALHAQLADDPSRSILDLEGVTLVDVEVVRFFEHAGGRWLRIIALPCLREGMDET